MSITVTHHSDLFSPRSPRAVARAVRLPLRPALLEGPTSRAFRYPSPRLPGDLQQRARPLVDDPGASNTGNFSFDLAQCRVFRLSGAAGRELVYVSHPKVYYKGSGNGILSCKFSFGSAH